MSEAGWTAETAEPPHYSLLIDRVVLPATPDNLQRFMERAWRALYSLDESWPFREAVDAEDVPDYYDIVKVSHQSSCVALCTGCVCDSFVGCMTGILMIQPLDVHLALQ